MPCNFIQWGGTTIDPSCVFDVKEQIKYLGSINIVTLHNDERLNAQGFGDDSIIKESKITKMQVDETKPNWIDLNIEMNELEDETSILQISEAKVREFF